MLNNYRIVTSSSPSRIEAHAGLFRLLVKGIFDPYVLWPFDKNMISSSVMLVRIRNYMVIFFFRGRAFLLSWSLKKCITFRMTVLHKTQNIPLLTWTIDFWMKYFIVVWIVVFLHLTIYIFTKILYCSRIVSSQISSIFLSFSRCVLCRLGSVQDFLIK